MVAKTAGSFLGGFFSNPSVLALTALGIGLFVFRDKISEAFAGFGESLGNLGNVNITLPEINFPTFEFPDITNIFNQDDSSSIAGETVESVNDSTIFIPEDTTVNPDGTVSSSTPPLLDLSDEERLSATLALEEGRIRSELENTLAEMALEPEQGSPIVDEVTRVINRDAQLDPIIQTGFTVEADSIFGDGPSFIGGTTTFGDNLVDTLSEVLAIFPQLSASQARDALNEFSGLTGTEFAQIDPDIINITGG